MWPRDASKNRRREPTLTLLEALELTRSTASPTEGTLISYLSCGFEPLHLATYLRAHLQIKCAPRRAVVESGLYGSPMANLKAAAACVPDLAFVVWEWADLDPRLSLRGGGAWLHAEVPDVLSTAAARAEIFREGVEQLAARTTVVVVGPSTPIPPAFYNPPELASEFTANLRTIVWSTLGRLSALPSVRVANIVDGANIDVDCEFQFGFPYTRHYAERLACLMVRTAFRSVPKKGLITDLDNTLWAGILGELGADKVSWHTEDQSSHHGLYQRLLASLAASGTLLAVASRNDRRDVDCVFRRSDLIVSPEVFFPWEVHMGPKVGSVARILSTWNVHPSDVVFVDDRPEELAAVEASHPDIRCLAFPPAPRDVYSLVLELRDLFGKQEVTPEDLLRVESLRRSEMIQTSKDAATGTAECIADLRGVITISVPALSDLRALDLLHKTNQFNLNGKRPGFSEWRGMLLDDKELVIVCSYTDKFGPLGRIAILAGRHLGDTFAVELWAMSCRAFSRNIENHILRWIVTELNVDNVLCNFIRTQRNRVMERFLATFVDIPLDDASKSVRIDSTRILAHSPVVHRLLDQRSR